MFSESGLTHCSLGLALKVLNSNTESCPTLLL